MAIAEPLTMNPGGFRVGLERDASVLWLTGEHDISTAHALRLMLIDLIALNEREVTVDLSEALFVGTVVVSELERARRHLLGRGRALTVRHPSPFVRRTFVICNAAHLLEPTPAVQGVLGDAEADLTANTT